MSKKVLTLLKKVCYYIKAVVETHLTQIKQCHSREMNKNQIQKKMIDRQEESC